MLIKMKSFFLSLCLLLFTSTCLASRFEELDRFNQCQLDRINALEPDHRVESGSAGLTETWNPRHPELQCAGVSFIRRTINPKGLHLPSFSPAPQLIIILQGKGVLGMSVPGCPETYEEPRSREEEQQQQRRDSHQKIRRFYKGDIIAIPPGTAYWTYNHGNEPLVAVSLLDTSNFLNQLDSTPRVFYVGGNPDVEFPETQQQQGQRRSPGGRRGGQHHQQGEEEQQNDGGSVLSGFSSEFLAQALNTDQDTARRLQSPQDERSQIVLVEDGLRIISPDWQEEEDEEQQEGGRRSHREEEEEDQPRRRRSQRGEEEEEEEQGPRRHRRHSQEGRRRSHGREDDDEEEEERHRRFPRHSQEEEEEDEDEEDEPSSREHRRQPSRRGEEEEEEEEEHRIERRSSRRSRGCGENGVEETICTAKIRENIAQPSRADLYNPRAGRISTVNSLTLPILRNLRLSAEYVVLYKNGIYAPHWNINSNSLIYVIRGRGRVQIVNCQGNAVFDDEVRKGQILVVPQNFVVAQQAGDEGFEYVAFKTNDRAAVSHVKQVFRATPAEVLENAFGLRQREITQIKFNGNRGPLVHPQSQQSRSHPHSRHGLIA